MSVYGVVIGFLLLFPWSLVGVIVVGAAFTGLKRRLGSVEPSRASGLNGCLCAAASAAPRSRQ